MGSRGRPSFKVLDTVEFETTVQREERTPMGMVLSNCRVMSVEPGSVAAAAGLFPSVKIVKINGTPVADMAAMKAAAGPEGPFKVTVEVHSGQRLAGTVRSWLAEKGFGFIEPKVPLLCPPGVLNSNKHSLAYIGDLYCHSSETNCVRSLEEGQTVAFTVKSDGVKLRVCNVTAEDGGPARPCPPQKDRLEPRPGSTVASLAPTEVCMLYAAGKCSVKSKACAKGLHVSKFPEPELVDLEKLATQQAKTEAKTALGFKEGDFPVRMRLVETGTGEVKEVTITRNEKPHGYCVDGKPFSGVSYDGCDVVRFLGFGSGLRFRLVKDASAARNLGLLRFMSECQGVPHNIDAVVPDPQATKPLDQILVKVSQTKLKLLRQQFSPSRVVNAWQLHNEALEFRFRATEHNMSVTYGKAPDMIDGYHGTAEGNVLSIALHGFDPLRRSGQVYGEGEYFAKDRNVSFHYCSGGSFMFICKLILGEEHLDHTWADGPQYYIMKQRNGNIQALPMYLIQFNETNSELARTLEGYSADSLTAAMHLTKMGTFQRGGVNPCKGRIDGCMAATGTKHVWVGWLNPSLTGTDEITEDVEEFLKGHEVVSVKPDRNGSRVGAFVELGAAISQYQLCELNTRPYLGQFKISVDDAQATNPFNLSRPCPKLKGPGRYCRGANLLGHYDWTEACSFSHEGIDRPVSDKSSHRFEYINDGAKYDELMRGRMKELDLMRITNSDLEAAYESRRSFLNEKLGCVIEKELWYCVPSDNEEAVLDGGLRCPSDTAASEACERSKGAAAENGTTDCERGCRHCTERHVHKDGCHPFGFGIQLSSNPFDAAAACKATSKTVLRCRVNLGNPYLVEASSISEEGLAFFQNLTRPEDPSDYLLSTSEDWNAKQGHDSYVVSGYKGSRVTQYVVYHPYQVLPLYAITWFNRPPSAP